VTELARLNQLSEAEFLATLGGVHEHSPWIAEQAFAKRPFPNRDHLVAAMRGIVDSASEEQKLALIRAHPDLAGKLARAGSLTPESRHEQAGLGLDRLNDEEYDRFSTLNAAYRERFGFPFIMCARLTTKDGVLAAFLTRLKNNRISEIAAALEQIHHIARLRTEDLIANS